MKILLLYPRWTENYGKIAHFAKKAGTWPPLNLAYLAAIAEQKGHEVKIIDGQVEDKSLEQVIEESIEYKPDLVGMTATTPFFHVVNRLAQALEKSLPKVPRIIGGHHITVLKDKEFYPHFDYAFIGEAEESWPQFLERYNNGRDISDVKGILYREKGEIKFTGAAPFFSDIDSVPFPARHLLKMDQYYIGTLKGIKNFTTVMTMRGCPFNCIFCSTEVFGRRVRKRSPSKVVEEMKSIISDYGIKHFMFLDDTLTLDRKHIFDICDIIEKENLGITFEGSTRANLVDEELINKMSRAGLIRLSFGLESVNENIRKIMKKEVPLEEYIEANRLTNKYHIETLNSCMIGLPGETRETVKETLDFLAKSKEIKQANISIAVPYPGTELYEMAKRGDYGLKLVTDDFSQFRRYNAAVMKVGDLEPEDLIDLQNSAFLSIYSAPWRWMPMIRKSGFLGAVLTFSRLIKEIGNKLKKSYRETHHKEW